jgi:Mannosyltransferase putative
MTDGIYILANDVVYDQLVALLNSLEVNGCQQFPICVVPYDDRLEQVRREIQTRDNVTLFEDVDAIARWENFATQVWQTHPSAMKTWQQQGINGVYRMGMHRRFCAFDGPFDKFIYLDADILAMNSLEPFFNQLDRSDWVVYDYQYKDPSHVYNLQSPNLSKIFPQTRVESEIFCAGLYASKRGVFDQERCNWLLSKMQAGEAEILYMNAPDQTILNYMVMRSGISNYNFSRHLPPSEQTGCCVTSPHFEAKDQILYDKGNRLIYLHYIGLSSQLFTRLCGGENIDFPYRDVFLHYRYLHEPEKRPTFTTKPKPYNPPPSLTTRVLRKLGIKS